MINIKQDGSIQDVNEAMVIATGKDRKQLIGQDFSSYFSDPEKARIGYQKVFAYGSVKDYELQMLHRSGSRLDVLFNARIFTMRRVMWRALSPLPGTSLSENDWNENSTISMKA